MTPSKKTTKKPAKDSANATSSKVSFCCANEKLTTIKAMFLFLLVRVRVIMQQRLFLLMTGVQFSHAPQRFI